MSIACHPHVICLPVVEKRLNESVHVAIKLANGVRSVSGHNDSLVDWPESFKSFVCTDIANVDAALPRSEKTGLERR